MGTTHTKQYADLFRRYNEFSSKFTPGGSRDLNDLHFRAVELFNALTAHFDTLLDMEAALQLNSVDGQYDDRVLLNVMLYSLGVAHPGFKKVISLLGADARSEHPVLLNSKARISLAGLFPTSLHYTSEWPRPNLWNAQQELNYSPDDFVLFHRGAVINQLSEAFFNNHEHLEKMIGTFARMSETTRASCYEHLHHLVAFHHVPLDYPARMLSINECPALQEALCRVEDLVAVTLHSSKKDAALAAVNHALEIIKSLPTAELSALHDKIVETYVAKSTNSTFTKEIDPIAASIHFIEQMRPLGFDFLNCVRAANSDLRSLDDSALLIALAERLPRVSRAGYSDDANACDLWHAAILHSQPLEKLLTLNMSTDAWLNLHVLIGDDRIRQKLHDHRHIESLLNHDLGL
jgi:hypothetical protein